MQKQINILPLVLLSLILSGCAMLQDLKPQTPREALVVAEYAYQGVVETATDLVTAGVLTSGEQTNILVALDRIEVARRAARQIILAGEPGSDAEAMDRYNIALTVLLDLARQYAAKYVIEGDG